MRDKPGVCSRFWRGCAYALPVSLLCWLAIAAWLIPDRVVAGWLR